MRLRKHNKEKPDGNRALSSSCFLIFSAKSASIFFKAWSSKGDEPRARNW